MNKKNLEPDEWFREKIDLSKLKDFQIARVTGVYKNSYTLRNQKNEVFAETTGNLTYGADSPLDYPTVGDWVYAQFFNQNTLAIINEVIPRKTVLKRKMPGKKISYQLIAANVDSAFIIQSIDWDFNIRRLERYLAIIKEGGIQPIVLLSKSDLLSDEAIDEKISNILTIMPDIKVIAFSNLNQHNLKQVKESFMPGKTYCLLSSSGVGKTTLLNQLIGNNSFKTQNVRKDGKGKHTTTNRQLIDLANGTIIIDTPGMREIGLIGSQTGIDNTFEDILSLSKHCRFNDCTHTKEKGCAVLAALNGGTLSRERYQNYIKVKKESAYYEMSYLEKRKKDKQLGKFYKSVLKNILKKKR